MLFSFFFFVSCLGIGQPSKTTIFFAQSANEPEPNANEEVHEPQENIQGNVGNDVCEAEAMLAVDRRKLADCWMRIQKLAHDMGQSHIIALHAATHAVKSGKWNPEPNWIKRAAPITEGAAAELRQPPNAEQSFAGEGAGSELPQAPGAEYFQGENPAMDFQHDSGQHFQEEGELSPAAYAANDLAEEGEDEGEEADGEEDEGFSFLEEKTSTKKKEKKPKMKMLGEYQGRPVYADVENTPPKSALEKLEEREEMGSPYGLSTAQLDAVEEFSL